MCSQQTKNMKASESSLRKLGRKITKLEEKIKQEREKNSLLRKELNYLRRRLKALILSRDAWKDKCRAKTAIIKNLQKRLKASAAKLNELKEVSLTDRIKRHHYSLSIISLCVLLRIKAGCSYRSIRRILEILQLCKLLSLGRVPCANSIENWVTKMGYYSIANVADHFDTQDFCLILDEHFSQGNERILLMVLTPYEKATESALAYKDVRVCYLGGAASWNGDKIKEKVDDLTAKQGINIKMILSDEDNKLLRAGRLLELPHLADIGHALASCLRKTFKEEDSYKALTKQVSRYQYKAVNQDLTFLRPPKQRTKARFMNQKKMVKWGLDMLNRWELLTKQEQTFFAALPNHRPILEILGQCIEVAELISMHLKVNGLSKETLKDVEDLMIKKYWTALQFQPIDLSTKVSTAPRKEQQGGQAIRALLAQQEEGDSLFVQFLKRLYTYVMSYEVFLKKAGEYKDSSKKGRVFNVSTDVIESFFGKYKNNASSNKLVGLSQLDLELPTYSLEINEELPNFMKMSLETTFVSDLKQFVESHSIESQAVKRAKFFQKGK